MRDPLQKWWKGLDDSLKSWWSRIGIALIPVFATLLTVFVGNPWLRLFDVLGEGYSTVLYLFVIMSTEIVISLPSQSQATTKGNRSSDVFSLLGIVVVWVSFVVFRSLYENAPNSQLAVAIVLILLASVYPSYRIIVKHRENAEFWNPEKRVFRLQEEPVEKMKEAKPAEATDEDGGKIKLKDGESDGERPAEGDRTSA